MIGTKQKENEQDRQFPFTLVIVDLGKETISCEIIKQMDPAELARLVDNGRAVRVCDVRN